MSDKRSQRTRSCRSDLQSCIRGCAGVYQRPALSYRHSDTTDTEHERLPRSPAGFRPDPDQSHQHVTVYHHLAMSESQISLQK